MGPWEKEEVGKGRPSRSLRLTSRDGGRRARRALQDTSLNNYIKIYYIISNYYIYISRNFPWKPQPRRRKEKEEEGEVEEEREKRRNRLSPFPQSQNR